MRGPRPSAEAGYGDGECAGDAGCVGAALVAGGALVAGAVGVWVTVAVGGDGDGVDALGAFRARATRIATMTITRITTMTRMMLRKV